MIFRQLRFKFSTEVGQQQNNMKKFYREASFSLNPKKAHPLHKYIVCNPATLLHLMEKQ
jgi:hypothetical protein